MQQIAVTHGFVKKLAKNLRGRYGRDVRHTEVIELVADALGHKAGPLMHALKHAAKDVENKVGDEPQAELATVGGLPKTSSTRAVCNVLAAIRDKDELSLPLYMGLLSPTSSAAKFVLAYAHRMRERLDTRTSIALLLESFEEEEFFVELAASAVVPDSITDEGFARFAMSFDYGENLWAEILAGTMFPRKMLAWAASHAVEHGFLAFAGDAAIVKKPPLSPKRYGFKVDHEAWTTNEDGLVVDGREEFLRRKCMAQVEELAATMDRNWIRPSDGDLAQAVSSCVRVFARDAVVGGAWPITRVEKFARTTIEGLLAAKYERPYL